jgi:hypothetical protein
MSAKAAAQPSGAVRRRNWQTLPCPRDQDHLVGNIETSKYTRELGLTGLRGWLAAPLEASGRKARATDRLNLSG